MAPRRFIGIDWGTSSMRAYLFAHDGRVLDSREAGWGVMNLPAVPGAHPGDRESQFSRAFWELLGDWLEQPGTCRRVMACGMVGSNQGWREAGYIGVPVGLADIAGSLTEVDAGQGVTLAITPGLLQEGALPDAIRGEETQIAGVPALLAQRGTDMQGCWLLGLPGTHSKWAAVRDGRILRFDTFLTGELYSLLVQHSILGRTMGDTILAPDSDESRQSFMLGVRNATTAVGRKGLLGTIFSSRTLSITGRLTGPEQREYLSGLLVGYEIQGLLASLQDEWRTARIALVGRPGLCLRYYEALQELGHSAEMLSEDAGIHGLWSLIRHDAARTAPS